MTPEQLNGLRKFAVMVGNGSGCFFQPVGAHYSYILTVKHNLNAEESIKTKIMLPSADDTGEDQCIEPIRIYEHDDKDIDAAIIQIEKRAGIAHLHAMNQTKSQERKGFWLIGFPDSRKDLIKKNGHRGDEYKVFKFEMLDKKKSEHTEFESLNNVDKPAINGMSGGGMMSFWGNKYQLFGIQTQMAAEDKYEVGRVWVLPIGVFEEIIKKHGLLSLYSNETDTEKEIIEKINEKVKFPFWEPRDCDEVVECLARLNDIYMDKEVNLENATKIITRRGIISQFKEIVEYYRKEANSDKKVSDGILDFAKKINALFW